MSNMTRVEFLATVQRMPDGPAKRGALDQYQRLYGGSREQSVNGLQSPAEKALTQEPNNSILDSSKSKLIVVRHGMCVTVPIYVSNPTNGSHGHWSKDASRRKQIRASTFACLQQCPLVTLPFTVTLIRVSPRLLDDDNLRPALKNVRDEIAKWVGIDDRDGRIKWEYDQQQSKRSVVQVWISK